MHSRSHFLIAGFLFGFPALRFGGLYLALATFALAVATPQLLAFNRLDFLTGGSSGLSLPITQGLKSELYWWALALMGLVIAASYALRKSTFGLGLLAFGALGAQIARKG